MVKLSAEDYEYRRTENSVSSINYHFVFVPKRRKAVLIGDMATRLQSIIFGLIQEHGLLIFCHRSFDFRFWMRGFWIDPTDEFGWLLRFIFYPRIYSGA